MRSILDCIGSTPLMQIGNIYFKLEYLNPSGSIKDRVAKAMITNLNCFGIKPVIVEATSGNTGVSVAMVCAALKLECIIFVPHSTSRMKIKLMQSYGAMVHTIEGNISKCVEFAKSASFINMKHIYLDQFSNKHNVNAQVEMATEARLQYNRAINNTHWNFDYHSVNAIVAGVGTGGTLMGLHKVFPNAEIFTLEVPSSDNIEGICDGVKLPLIPKELRINTINVSYTQAVSIAKWLAEKHGIHCGVSSGANYYAATVIQKKYRHILTVFPDSGSRYL